jgi:hypothetical protein
MTNIKHYFNVKIPYWKHRYVEFTLCKISYEDKYRIQFTIWLIKKLVDIKGYEDEFGTNWWKHFVIYSKK